LAIKLPLHPLHLRSSKNLIDFLLRFSRADHSGFNIFSLVFVACAGGNLVPRRRRQRGGRLNTGTEPITRSTDLFLRCGEFALEESIFRAVQARSVRDFPGEEARGGRSGDAQPNPPKQQSGGRAEEGIGDPVIARMAGSMQAAEAAGRLSALLSLLALRRLLAVLQPLVLLLLLPFRWRMRPVAVVVSAAAGDAVAASGPSGKKGKSSSSSVVLRVPAGSPMVAARRQASARREVAIRRAREAGREYELIPTPRGETLFTQWWWPHPPSSAIKPRLDNRIPQWRVHMCLKAPEVLFPFFSQKAPFGVIVLTIRPF
jgi:hypothetical protein